MSASPQAKSFSLSAFLPWGLPLVALIVVALGLACAGTYKFRLIELPSGLSYQILREGKGATPGPNDRVAVHYEGRLENGTIFDSSYVRAQPEVLSVDQVIPGWSQGLQRMQAGGKYRLLIPSDLAYGPTGAGGVIPPNANLVFDIELLAVQGR